MINPYRAFRQLERLVFRGVPEQPEPIWLRDRNAHVPERLTGRSQLAGGLPADWREGAQLLVTVVYRPASLRIEYEPSTQPAPINRNPDLESRNDRKIRRAGHPAREMTLGKYSDQELRDNRLGLQHRNMGLFDTAVADITVQHPDTQAYYDGRDGIDYSEEEDGE